MQYPLAITNNHRPCSILYLYIHQCLLKDDVNALSYHRQPLVQPQCNRLHWVTLLICVSYRYNKYCYKVHTFDDLFMV